MGNAGLRALNLGGGDADTSTPMGSMVITVMATRVLTDVKITREMSTDPMPQRQPTDNDFGGRRPTCTKLPDPQRRPADQGGGGPEPQAMPR